MILSFFLGRLFSTVQLKTRRRRATTRSPVFSLLSEGADGLVTFRAYGLAESVLADFIERLHVHLRPVYQARQLGRMRYRLPTSACRRSRLSGRSRP